MTTTEPDIVIRLLTVGLCLPLFFVGLWGLLLPRSYQKGLLGLSRRVPDRISASRFVRFLNSSYFIFVLRLSSLFPIGLGIAILFSLRR